MKRVLLLVMVLFSALALIACNGGTKDEVKPVISVPAAEVTISVGDTFDPKLNVTATDDVDGDLTSKIVITGTVDTTKPGVYEITYSVKDAAGNEGTRTVKVTVEAPAVGVGLANLINGDFADGLEGWDNWVNEGQGSAAEFTIEDGKAVVNITAQETGAENNWWDVQFKQNTINFKALESFTLKFTVSAEHDRYMMLNLQGGGAAKKSIDSELVKITTEPQEFSFDFFNAQNVENGELQFAFGSFHKVDGVPEAQHVVLGKVYFHKVEVVEGPELVNQPPVIEGRDVVIEVGQEFLVNSGITVRDDRDSLNLSDLTVEALGAELDVNTAGIYEYKYSVKDSEGLEGTLTRKIHVGSFNLPPFENWTKWHADSAAQTVETTETTATIDIETLGGNPWENQFKAEGLLALKGKYQIKFIAKSSVARTIIFALESNFGVDVERNWHRVELTTEDQEFTFEIELGADATAAGSFQFFLGDASTTNNDDGDFTDGTYVPSIITISNFTVTKVTE
jgi:hypothetical protein